MNGIEYEWFLQELEMASVFAIKISIYIVCVNLHSMIKLMLTFVNSGLRKTNNHFNIMPKHPKVGANTPLTTRSNNSVEGDGLSLSFSILFFSLQDGVENLIVNLWLLIFYFVIV